MSAASPPTANTRTRTPHYQQAAAKKIFYRERISCFTMKIRSILGNAKEKPEDAAQIDLAYEAVHHRQLHLKS